MGYSRSLMLRNWQNKGNVFFVYNLLLIMIVMDKVIQSGKPKSFCRNFYFFSTWVFFHKHGRFTGHQQMGEDHLPPTRKHLDIKFAYRIHKIVTFYLRCLLFFFIAGHIINSLSLDKILLYFSLTDIMISIVFSMKVQYDQN